MSRTLLTPISEVEHEVPDFLEPVDQPKRDRLLGQIELALLDRGLTQTLKRDGRINDPGWRKDLASLVQRCESHMITEIDPKTKLTIVSSVQVRLMTLTPEVDDDGAICAWIYEES